MSAQLPNPPPSNPYQSMLAPHPTVHQGQYHSLANPTSQQYLQPSAGMMSPYSYGSIAALPSVPPPPPPPAPPSYMTMTQQPLSMMQQGAAAQQQQPPLPQQPPPPNFRPVTPVQPPGMLYYSQPYHSQQ